VALYNQVVSWLDDECSTENQSPWVVRMAFNQQAMYEKNISVYEIERAIRRQYNWAYCIFSNDNANECIMRMRIANGNSDDIQSLTTFQAQGIENFCIDGIDGLR